MYHTPILLKEVIEGLEVGLKADGVFVDCTFGGGSHSRQILSLLHPGGKLIGFDQDEDARQNLPEDNRFIFVPNNFRHLQRFLRLHKIIKVDGVLADLGVSSHQFDKAERGFSIRLEGDLDMRMDKRQVLSAYDVVTTYSEERLHKLFEQYGEVTNARTLALTIVSLRRTVSFKTVNDFKTALSALVKGNPNKYFAQVFQALRIEVNDELGALREMLQQVPQVLKPGGRVAIISFHSLEDRIVKNFFRKRNLDEGPENPFLQETDRDPVFKIITRKPIVPGTEELAVNSRARSAKLRIAELIK
ncbi:MAG: 16S rRNA (cytosine(1402)-N(4))-methyltransferase RsmH [Chitinophagaceae bacterium]